MLPTLITKHLKTNPQARRMNIHPHPTPKLQIFTTITDLYSFMGIFFVRNWPVRSGTGKLQSPDHEMLQPAIKGGQLPSILNAVMCAAVRTPEVVSKWLLRSSVH